MNLKFKNKKITGILSVLPENEINFEDEIDNYNFSRSTIHETKISHGF